MADTNPGETAQYLTFMLDGELFAVEIGKVREVLEFSSVTKVPRTPDYMRGVINLRGSVVPVIDLRLKLGLSRTETTVNTCVVIAEVDIDHEKTVLGVLVDSVQEVIDLEAGQVAPPPRMGAHIDSDVIRGMGKREDQFIILLDIDRILTSTEIQTASALSAVESGDQATP